MRASVVEPDESNVRRTRRMKPGGRLAAVIAIVIIAAACSGGGDGHRAVPTSTAPAATRLAATPPSAGFLSALPGNDTHALAVWSWNGHRIATAHTKAAVQCCGVDTLSPDGTRLLTSDSGPGATPHAEVIDLHGRVLAGVTGLVNATWADDSRHLCDLRPHQPHPNYADGPADLVLVDPGERQRVVAQVPGYGPHKSPGILRCSVKDNEAVVADYFMGPVVSVTTVRLSTGRRSTPSWVRPDDSPTLAVSGNGRYVLEAGNTPDGILSRIIDARTGTEAGEAVGQPEAISWNGHLVVVSSSQGKVLVVVDWRTRTDRWQSAPPNGPAPVPEPSAAVSARPDSDDLALTVSSVPGHDPGSSALWLVTPSTHELVDNAVIDSFV